MHSVFVLFTLAAGLSAVSGEASDTNVPVTADAGESAVPELFGATTLLPGRTREATLDWLAAARAECDQWTTITTIGDVKTNLVCDGNVDAVLIARGNELLHRQDCQRFCIQSENTSCCELSINRDGDQCKRTNGKAVLQIGNEFETTSTFELCKTIEGSLGAMFALGQSNSEYHCPADKMQNAIKIDGDGPGLCSQICLPHSLWGIARRRGVEEGNCKDRGYKKFKYQSSNAGIPYNVYGR